MRALVKAGVLKQDLSPIARSALLRAVSKQGATAAGVVKTIAAEDKYRIFQHVNFLVGDRGQQIADVEAALAEQELQQQTMRVDGGQATQQRGTGGVKRRKVLGRGIFLIYNFIFCIVPSMSYPSCCCGKFNQQGEFRLGTGKKVIGGISVGGRPAAHAPATGPGLGLDALAAISSGAWAWMCSCELHRRPIDRSRSKSILVDL